MADRNRATATPQAWIVCAVAAASIASLGVGARAQPAPSAVAPAPPAAAAPAREAARETSEPARRTSTQPARLLPPARTTSHTLSLGDRTLIFDATAGAVTLTSGDGKPTGEMAYVAYQLQAPDRARRPVTFAFNGGPGSASAWVHIGGFGPWRLPLETAGLSPASPPALRDNAETWLDFTDLVFIDPIGTGHSRALPGAERDFNSVNGDAASVAQMIARWLAENDRRAAPKIIAGESYGGIRAPKVAVELQSAHGLSVHGLILISPVLDFGLFRGPRHHTAMFVHALPSIAAAAREDAGIVVEKRADLSATEAYARSDFLVDLMRGPRDREAMDRLVGRVSEIARFPPDIVRQYAARIDESVYLRERHRGSGRRASAYDTTVKGLDPDPNAPGSPSGDPFTAALAAPIRGAMADVHARLGWRPETDYMLLSTSVNASWNWGGGARLAESFTQLRALLAVDPRLKVLVTHGFTDLRTPYFGSVLVLEQLPAFAEGRVTLEVYPGGHMHYSRDASRVALRTAARGLVENAVPTR